MKRILLYALLFASLSLNAQTWTIKNNELKLTKPIEFVSGSAKLKVESDAALEEIAAYLNAKTYITLMRVEGHVDAPSNSQALSEQRAVAVGKWLVDHGIDCKRIIVVGFGNTKPISEIKAENNRISVVNAAVKDRPIGGMPVDGGGRVAGNLCK